MPTLKSCIKCGKPVSSAVSCCPHCGYNSYDPNLTSCDLCKQSLRKLEAITIGSNETLFRSSASRGLSYHSYCFQKYDPIQLKCPTCNQVTSRPILELGCSEPKKIGDTGLNLRYVTVKYRSNCKNCGQLIIFDGCNYCGLPIQNNEKVRFKVSYNDGEIDTYKTFDVHPECKSNFKGSCFIATAACGEDSLEVQTLRVFCDQYLLSHPIGNLFVQVYQKLSPPLASAIQNQPIFKLISKFLIVNPAFQIAKLWMKAKSNPD
ncbi:MAG TPA: hypothetical protein IGS17_06220 [Oscillatoriales cyanobacterium M59_W2019_021]|nr:hypothetical protein [Oscillatoriales cyanobacterium M59_W2019_021]